MIGSDDNEHESDDHELGVDGNLCDLGIVATVSSQLSQKDIQLAMGPSLFHQTLQTTAACFFFLLTAHLPVQHVSVAAQTHFWVLPLLLFRQASVMAHLWPVIGHYTSLVVCLFIVYY